LKLGPDCDGLIDRHFVVRLFVAFGSFSEESDFVFQSSWRFFNNAGNASGGRSEMANED
jgi:hypothetical protein